MFGSHKTEALVAGAGPVGLFAAIALQERGVRVAIYDQDSRMASRSYALALHPNSLAMLDEIGLAQRLISLGTKIETIGYYEGANRQAEVDYRKLDGPFPFLLIVPQNVLEHVLHDRLLQQKVKTTWNHRVQTVSDLGDHLEAEIHKLDQVTLGYPVSVAEAVITKTVHATSSFLIGADGYSSQIRNILDVDYDHFGDIGTFFVSEFECDREPDPEVRVVLEEGSTNVFWPIAGRRVRWGFQIEAADLANEPIATRLDSYLRTRAPWFKPRAERIFWSTEIKFERRLVRKFGAGRIWLLGDSAHLTSPVGVQSVNVGLREAHDLAVLLSNILLSDAPLSGLEGFDQARQAEWRRLLGLGGPVQVPDDTTPWVAARADRFPSCIPASGRQLDKLLSQIGLEIPVERRESVDA